MARLPRCIVPGCKRTGVPVQMPLTGGWRALCDVHRGPAFLAHMAELVAHG